jgi:hypothetical protein
MALKFKRWYRIIDRQASELKRTTYLSKVGDDALVRVLPSLRSKCKPRVVEVLFLFFTGLPAILRSQQRFDIFESRLQQNG